MIETRNLRASDATGQAVLAHITVARAPGATVITVDSLSKWPPYFICTTGTLDANGYLIPASMTELKGHSSGSTIVIDSFEPGSVDIGNTISPAQVAIIKQTTGFANMVQDAIVEIQTAITVDLPLRQSHGMYDYVVPGTCVWAGIAYGATLNAGMTLGTCYINGNRNTLAAVASRAFTANKDTYVDILYNASGVGTLVYTETANNAGAPVLAANSIRLAIIVSGATNILNVASINQGQLNKLLPIVSSKPFTLTDDRGNLICPVDPSFDRMIGYREIQANASTTGTSDMIGLDLNCLIPVGRNVEVEGFFANGTATAANNAVTMNLQDVTAGVQLAVAGSATNASGDAAWGNPRRKYTPAASGLRNYKAQISRGVNAATANSNSTSTNPAYIAVRLA